MSSDFDARVRDLNEAPLSLDEVKGKAVKIRRNRRLAAAGGALAVAAAITPIAFAATNTGDSAPPPATQNVEDPATATEPAYIVDGVWHQADGDEVDLPQGPSPYSSAAMWDDQLVATRWDGEVFSTADVIDSEGNVVDSFSVAGDVVADDTHQTIAWVAPDGTVMTRSDGGELAVGELDMSAPGETIAWSAAAVTGGSDCSSDECRVYVNSALGQESAVLSSLEPGQVAPLDGALEINDANADGTLTVVTSRNEDGSLCSGRYLPDPEQPEVLFETCDYTAEQFSPDGEWIAAVASYQSGLGAPSIYILGAEKGEQTDLYGVEAGHVGTWAWAADGRLLFDTYDGAGWHLWAMEPGTGGAAEELVGPTPGEDVDSPFLLLDH